MFAGRILSALFLLLAIAGLCCCGKRKADDGRKHLSVPADLNDPKYTIGIVAETTSGEEAKKAFPLAKFREYENISDIYPLLENGTLDAIAFDRPVLDYAQRTRDVFVLMPDNYSEGHVAIAVSPSKPELLQYVNAFLLEYFSSGLYDAMFARWIKSSNPQMPEIPAPRDPQGKLVIGTENMNEPMNFTDSNGEPTGFDIELIRRMALAFNVDVEIRVMPYHDLFTAVETSAVDIAVAAMDSGGSEGRNILFSEDYLDCPAGILTRKDIYRPAAGAGKGGKTIQELAGNYAAILSGSKYAAECKELLPNPCHTFGLMMSGDQNDDNTLRNVAVQGFRYGFVLSEHVIADYLYIHPSRFC